jgi:hypothetical protein
MCPHCQQKLTIPDQYAGQLMRCPLCNGTFTAPALTAPPPPVFSLPESSPPPTPPPLPTTPEPMRQPPPVESIVETVPPPPPGEYSRSWKIVFSPRVIPWIPPVGLLLVFLLSFLPWISLRPPLVREAVGFSAWNIGFGISGSPGDGLFATFLILTILAMILAIPSSLFALGLAPTPPFVKAIGPWRPVIAGGVALLSFLFLLIRYLDSIFSSAPMTIWFKLAFRFHLAVIVAALVEFWLELRRAKNLPPPRIETHW